MNVYRYILPINDQETSDTDESTTCAVLTMTSNRPRQRRVLMMKYLKHTFSMPRAIASRCIREMGFNDITLCGS